MPRGHDTWQYLALQYYFLNDHVTNGIVPQWMPYMTQGTVSNWWFAVQSSILQSIYFDFGPLLSKINFLPLGYFTIVFEELILLLGVWKLSSRYYESGFSIFFVSVAIAGSAVWIDQVWWNFHLYYAVPLILVLIHEAIDEYSWVKLFLGVNLMFFSLLGDMPYLLSVETGFVAIYFALYIALDVNQVRQKLLHWKFSISSLGWIVFSGFTMIYIYAILTVGTKEIVNSNIGRDATGASTLEGFLTYGGQVTLAKFHEIFTGVSLTLDQTLYAGAIVLPLSIIAILFNCHRRSLHILIVGLVFILLSSGSSSIVAQTVYYLIPGASYFRHVGLIGSYAKICFCFLAGFGMDYLVVNITERRKFRYVCVVVLGLFATVSFAQYKFPQISISKLSQIAGQTPNSFMSVIFEQVPFRHLFVAFILGFVAVLLMFSSLVKHRRYVLIMICALQWVDVMVYRNQLFFDKTVALIPQVYHLYDFQKIPYSPRRVVNYSTNPRFMALKDYLFSQTECFADGTLHAGMLGNYGSISWWAENFLFIDPVAIAISD